MLEAETRTNIVITDQTTCFGPYQNQGMFSVITTLAHIKKNNRRTQTKKMEEVKREILETFGKVEVNIPLLDN